MYQSHVELWYCVAFDNLRWLQTSRPRCVCDITISDQCIPLVVTIAHSQDVHKDRDRRSKEGLVRLLAIDGKPDSLPIHVCLLVRLSYPIHF